MFSRSSSTSIRSSQPIQQRPSVGQQQRPSVSSRISSAISVAEQGDAAGAGQARDAPAQRQIEDEIAEIKRYEVRSLLR